MKFHDRSFYTVDNFKTLGKMFAYGITKVSMQFIAYIYLVFACRFYGVSDWLALVIMLLPGILQVWIDDMRHERARLEAKRKQNYIRITM